VWPILLPLIGTILTFLFKRGGATTISLVMVSAITLAVAGLTRQVLQQGEQYYAVGGWEAPLGITLHADGLSVLMLIMTTLVGASTSVYAMGYVFQGPRAGSAVGGYFFWPLWMFLWTALNVIFLSADIFNLYVGLEILSLSAVALVTLEGKPAAIVAGMRYLLASFLGSLAFLLGVALLYTASGTLELNSLGTRMLSNPSSGLALALIMLGLALKTALFPLHFWLPPAHASAAAPVSALLSGLVVKATFYMVLRLWFDVFPAIATPAVAQILGALGAVGILWGSILALRQPQLKLLIAFSTVAQVGYLFLLFPLSNATTEIGMDAWSGGVYFALAHSCAKAAAFMAAGTLVYALGSDRLDALPGTFRRYPLSVVAFTVAGVNLMGLPPSGGFIAKWLLLTSALNSGQWWFALVILAGSLLGAGYVFMVLSRMLLDQPQPIANSEQARPVTLATELSALALAVFVFVLGVTATPLIALLRIGAPF